MRDKTTGTFKVSASRIGKWRIFANKTFVFCCGKRCGGKVIVEKTIMNLNFEGIFLLSINLRDM